MLWYRTFSPITPSAKRLRCLRPANLLTIVADTVCNKHNEHLTRQSACSLEVHNRNQTYSLSSLTASNSTCRLPAGTPKIYWAALLHSPSSTDKPSQGDDGASLAPDIGLLSPELQHEWHLDRNMHLGPVKVKPYSQIKAVWQCDKCPAGQPHIWKAVVYSRTRGAQCPYCTNRHVCLHNSLAAAAPDMAQY